MKKITWVTPDYFVDCDLNPNVFSYLLKKYMIHWIVLLPIENSRFKESDFDEIRKLNGLTIEFQYYKYSHKDPRITLFYLNLYRLIRRQKCDLLYLNLVPGNPFRLPFFILLNKYKTIFTAHDGDVKPDVPRKRLVQMCFDMIYPYVKYVNMFSPSQAEVFRFHYPKAKIFMNLLALKDYGICKLPKRDDKIVFFCFGTLHDGKHIDLLINAACNIHEMGVRGFKISINGSCPNWEFYKSKIKYPDLFECTIRMIDNSEIPALFTQNHYMVLPYKIISQSGALKVAFNYNVPVIVSDLRGFTDEVKDGINGYIFENDNLGQLEKLLIKIVTNHNEEYLPLCNKMKKYTQENYSSNVLASKLEYMFEEVFRFNKL